MCKIHCAGRLNPGVTFTLPAGSGCPCSCIIAWQASRRRGPATEWMTLSIHRCVGWKQPSNCELAAFTMAVISVSVVISPFQRCRLVWTLGKDTTGGMVCDGVKSLWLCWYCKIASISDRIWRGNGGCAGRIQSSCCRVCNWIQIS